MKHRKIVFNESVLTKSSSYIKLIGFIPFIFILPTWISWLYSFFLSYLLYKTIINNNNDKHVYTFINIYIIYITIVNICGFLIAENYWDYKSLINNLFKYYTIGIVIWASNIIFVYKIYKQAFYTILFSSLICFFITKSLSFIYAIAFSITPYLLFYGMRISKKISFIILILLIFCLLSFNSIQRIDIVKILFSIIFFIIFRRVSILNANKFKYIAIFFFTIPFILLYTSIIDVFNPFKMDDYIKGEYSTSRIENGEIVEENFKADTRSSIYIDIFNSLNEHQSWFFGRTPTQGYETLYIYTSDFQRLGISERNSSEVGLLNVLLHYGIIGFILYSLIIIYGTWLAFQHSNNSYCKLLGFYMSFFYCISWIWQPPQLSLFYVFDMIMLGLCYSTSLRKLTNKDIREFIIKYSI